MNKGELIQALAAKTDMNGAEAGRALDAVLGALTQELSKGGQISLVGFGTFGVSKRNARTGKNPRTGEAIKIAARKVVKFSPGKALRDAVNGTAKKPAAKAAAKGGAKAPAKGGAKAAKKR